MTAYNGVLKTWYKNYKLRSVGLGYSYRLTRVTGQWQHDPRFKVVSTVVTGDKILRTCASLFMVGRNLWLFLRERVSTTEADVYISVRTSCQLPSQRIERSWPFSNSAHRSITHRAEAGRVCCPVCCCHDVCCTSLLMLWAVRIRDKFNQKFN